VFCSTFRIPLADPRTIVNARYRDLSSTMEVLSDQRDQAAAHPRREQGRDRDVYPTQGGLRVSSRCPSDSRPAGGRRSGAAGSSEADERAGRSGVASCSSPFKLDEPYGRPPRSDGANPMTCTRMADHHRAHALSEDDPWRYAAASCTQSLTRRRRDDGPFGGNHLGGGRMFDGTGSPRRRPSRFARRLAFVRLSS
jgi:hypothetical protein